MCPVQKSTLDNILNNPNLTPDEQTKLTSIEAKIDSLLQANYDGTFCDIDRIQYFEVSLQGVLYERKDVIYQQLVLDYSAAGWLITQTTTVIMSVFRFTAPGNVIPNSPGETDAPYNPYPDADNSGQYQAPDGSFP